MKNWKIITVLIFMIMSCEGELESSYCHKGISIVNSSKTPIRVCRIWGFVSENTSYAMRDDADKIIVYPGDTTFIDIVGWKDCLENVLEWSSTHPDYYNPSLRTIYVCDTVRPTQTFYSTSDSVLLNHNILKLISVVNTGIERLKECNFIVHYP